MKKTLAKDIKSPFTGGRVFLVEDVETQEFRKKAIKYTYDTLFVKTREKSSTMLSKAT